LRQTLLKKGSFLKLFPENLYIFFFFVPLCLRARYFRFLTNILRFASAAQMRNQSSRRCGDHFKSLFDKQMRRNAQTLAGSISRKQYE